MRLQHRCGAMGYAAVLIAAVAAVPTAAQPVTGDVVAVGFRAPVSSGFVIREGQWIPILCELVVNGSDHFEGAVRWERPDLDGDRVAFTARPVTLTRGQGLKRVWCYAVSTREDPTTGGNDLEIVAADGAIINRLPLKPYEVISNDTVLILDISERPLALSEGLGGKGVTEGESASGVRPFYRPLMVAKMAAEELPDRAFGLEAVNIIVWDEPDPAKVSIAQLEALVDWVKGGGQLIVGLGSSWNRVRDSALGKILPVGGSDPTITVRKLDLFFQNFVAGATPATEFPTAIAIPGVKATRGLQLVNDFRPDRSLLNLVVLDSVGSGRVTVVTPPLRPLLAMPLRKEASLASLFMRELIDLTEFAPNFRRAQAEAASSVLSNVYRVYEDLIRPVEFQEAGGLLVFFAMVFVIAYILTATVATWFWLRRRNLTHLSWTFFAVVAVAGSFLSLAAVAVTRGFPRVHSVALIDVESGASQGRATCYFGYRSPFRERLTLSLPGEGNYLRPLTPARRDLGVFATPERYTAVAAGAVLEGALLRSTLKQFEGVWSGPLEGAIRTQLTLRTYGDRVEVTPDSYIRNDMPFPITGGYLLFLDPRLPGSPERAAGAKPHPFRRELAPPGLCVIALRIPELKSGAQLVNIGQAESAELERQLAAWSPDPDPSKPSTPRPDLPTLLSIQTRSTRSALGIQLAGRNIGDVEDAALLVSTRNLHLPCAGADAIDRVGTEISTVGLVDRDISHWLVYGQGVLLLFADDPGPARLHRDGQPVAARSGKSLYRVRVPIQYPK